MGPHPANIADKDFASPLITEGIRQRRPRMEEVTDHLTGKIIGQAWQDFSSLNDFEEFSSLGNGKSSGQMTRCRDLLL
jgi:hypothetical protein